MKKIIVVILLITSQFLSAQKQGTLLFELKNLYDFSLLPSYRTGTIAGQVSSWDTTGGNSDGFDGRYSFIRKTSDKSLVIFDQKGPGVINRIATPTPAYDTLDFYIDNNLRPSLSVSYMDLFTGRIFPFTSPLCGYGAGGYYCYFPILFQNRCMIVCRGKSLQFHQIQYRIFPKGTIVESFSSVLSPDQKRALENIREVWSGKTTGFVHAKIQTGRSVSLTNGGRILGIEVEGISDSSRLQITWDHEKVPAVDCPAKFFFNQSMNSILLGGKSDGSGYSYFPMPFDRHAFIEIKGSPGATLKVYYSSQKRDRNKEGKFHAAYKTNYLGENDPYHVFLDIKGRGHYVGTILWAEGVKKGSTTFFEGDDSTATDGVFRIHGTGSEDYFNGGKRYPVIFHYYESKSDELNRYHAPEIAIGDINVPWFVSRGYIVFIPDIKYTVRQTGKSALNAVVSAANYLKQFFWVDTAHMGLQGHSYGGFETNYIITHSTIFKAAVESAGVTDLVSIYCGIGDGKAGDQMSYFENGQGRMGGATLWEQKQSYIDESPIFNADKITTPVLMVHNKKDPAVPWTQGVELFTALWRLQKPAWMLQYDGSDHGQSGADALDYTIRITQFFDHYLKGMPPPKWMTDPGYNATAAGYELDISGKQP